jgi:hypothetical protein
MGLLQRSIWMIPKGGGHIGGSDPPGGGRGTRGTGFEFGYLSEFEFIFEKNVLRL